MKLVYPSLAVQDTLVGWAGLCLAWGVLQHLHCSSDGSSWPTSLSWHPTTGVLLKLVETGLGKPEG